VTGEGQAVVRGGPRRRRANVDGGRSEAVLVRVTPAEKQLLAMVAEQAGVSVPRLLVESTLRNESPQAVKDRRDLLALMRGVQQLVGRVGTNVNQITRAVNATGETGKELAGTLAGIRRMLDRVDEAMDEVAAR